jgi:hypothetical protein
MDVVTAVSAGIGTLVAVLIPALIFAYWLGGLAMRQRSHEEKCEGECERQNREHSRLFQRADSHERQIAGLQSDVKGLDRRIVILEGMDE